MGEAFVKQFQHRESIARTCKGYHNAVSFVEFGLFGSIFWSLFP